MADQGRVEELEKLLREAELRAESSETRRLEAQQRAEKEQQRAEEERHRAAALDTQLLEEQQLRLREQRRADASEEQTRLTTFGEYIEACHTLVFSKLVVERDQSLTSKGSITNPKNKLCPTTLQEWPHFIEQQRRAAGLLHAAVPAGAGLFESRNLLAGLGDRVSQRPVANEKGLEYFLHNSVEDPVRFILHQLKDVEQIRNVYDVGDGIIFENHPSAISDVSEEVAEQENASPPRTPPQTQYSQQLRPDQICIYRSEGGDVPRRTMVYVCEYKAPHKLTAPHLRAGLRRPMNIYKEVVNRKTIPTSEDPEGLFKYRAERLTAAAISQTYHYMIEGGLEYGLLTTGETIVFLKVDWHDPATLYYHLAEPGPEVPAHPEDWRFCTAVSQYLAFTVSALGEPGQRRGHSQEERRQAIQRLKTWAEDFETTLRSIPASERSAPDSSVYAPSTYAGTKRSPLFIRVGGRIVRRGDDPEKQPTRRDSQDSSSDESRRHLPDTPSPAERRAASEQSSQQSGTRRSQRIKTQQQQQQQQQRKGGRAEGTERPAPYCTQRCLLGLVRGGQLDMRCPNVRLHIIKCGRCTSTSRHPITHDKFLRLLEKQLKKSLDDGVDPLGDGGARGVLFRVTLLAYGYTFVAKGTVRAFIKHLEHEAAVYERLQTIQGSRVPVFLGTIDLRSMDKIYYYDHRVYVVHLTCMSWAGRKLEGMEATSDRAKELAEQTLQSLRLMHQAGVVHRDVREANLLFNPETNGIVIIDFERSSLMAPLRRVLGPVVPNKRAWRKESFDKKSGGDGHVAKHTRGVDVGQDLLMARLTFLELFSRQSFSSVAGA